MAPTRHRSGWLSLSSRSAIWTFLRSRRWWSRALAMLLLIPVGGGAWFARQNHFEWMFNPLTQPEYVDAAEGDLRRTTTTSSWP